MSFPVGKLGGFFDTVADAKDFAGRQLDTVIEVSGSVKSGAKTAQNVLSGSKTESMSKPWLTEDISDTVKKMSPIVWVGIAAAIAYFAFGKKR